MLTYPQTSSTHLKMLADIVKDQDIGNIINCPALKKKKEHLNNNYLRHLIIGKYAPKLLSGENLHPFSVPLRCKFSTMSSLGPESHLSLFFFLI